MWEEDTLGFFEVNITLPDAIDRVYRFVDTATFYDGPSNDASFSTYPDNPDGTITLYALALNGSDSVAHGPTGYASPITIEHTDTAFHLFLLNLTNNSSTANSILRAFPAGLLTPSGLVVANLSLSNSDVLVAGFTNSAYHGTVIWSWQLALMAEGLHRQLAACNASSSSQSYHPPHCGDESVYRTVRSAYNVLWDNIEQNEAQLQSEVWSWTCDGSDSNNGTSSDGFTTVPLGSISGGTESNVRQLWSLTFLAVTRDHDYSP